MSKNEHGDILVAINCHELYNLDVVVVREGKPIDNVTVNVYSYDTFDVVSKVSDS
jgi:uncharacterized GH25 family protein